MSSAHFPNQLVLRTQRFQRAVHDPSAIIPAAEDIVWRDNEEGLLKGTDRFGRPLHPLAESTLRTRKGTGPPLIPRYRASRMIKNYQVGHIRKGPGNFQIITAWEDVLSKKGVPFIPFHVEGRGHNPVRDIAGLRPAGKEKLQAAMTAWLKGELKGMP